VSKPQLSPERLAQPAARAARLMARERLAAATTAFARLGGDDPQALHDLRVAVRRLRTCLRAYRPVLDDTVTRRSRRALAKLARATNNARDAEVALAWLRALPNGGPESQPDHERLLASLPEQEQRATQSAARYLARRLPDAARRLSRQLEQYYVRRSVDRNEEILMGTLTARLVRQQRRRLAAALARVRAPSDVTAAHRARIEGKHLRYLLEPLDADRQVAHAVRRLKALQDRLGAHHDAQLLAGRLRKAGAPELAALAERDGVRAFTAFRRSWNARRTAADLRDIDAIAASVAGGRRGGRAGRKSSAEPARAAQRRDRRTTTRS
jgi:CHAD domain-containing protein